MKDEICLICRENECDFETKCGHNFHEKCFISATKNSNSTKSICPHCTQEIFFIQVLDKIIADPVKLSDSVADLNLSKSSILKIVEYSAEKGDLEFIKSGYFTLH